MQIAVGSDHAGLEAKEAIVQALRKENYPVEDMGTYSSESVDYPDIAEKVARLIIEKECERGILICGTGIGMSMAANKIKGIRAALCHNE